MDKTDAFIIFDYNRYKRNRFFTQFAFLLLFLLFLFIIDVLRRNSLIDSLNIPNWLFLLISIILFSGPMILLKTVIFSNEKQFELGNLIIKNSGIKVDTRESSNFYESEFIDHIKFIKTANFNNDIEVWKIKYNYQKGSYMYKVLIPVNKIRNTIESARSLNNQT